MYNCARQRAFRDQYRSTLSYDLYSFLKDGASEKSGPLLRAGLSDATISLLVQIIRDLVIGGQAEIEAFSGKLKADMIQASERSDVEFINKVIMPILQAEEKVPITISMVDEASLRSGKGANLQPIYADSEATDSSASRDNFFLKTNILNKKQKSKFSQMFKELTHDKVENFPKLMSSKWDLIFEDKAHQN